MIKDLIVALSAGGWLVVAVLVLLAGVLFLPWTEPARRAERLIQAWKGHPIDKLPNNASTNADDMHSHSRRSRTRK
jgi:hypothetical protein